MLFRQHSMFLARIFQTQVDSQLIEAVTRLAYQSMPMKLNSNVNPTPLIEFTATLVRDTHISPAVLYVGIVYLIRVRMHLPPNTTGIGDTAHRLILAAFIIAEKYLCDVPLKNTAWEYHAKHYSLNDINLMERQFLELLNYQTHVEPEELYQIIAAQRLKSTKTPTSIELRSVPYIVGRPHFQKNGVVNRKNGLSNAFQIRSKHKLSNNLTIPTKNS